MESYLRAAVERAMKVQEVIMRAMAYRRLNSIRLVSQMRNLQDTAKK